MTQRSIDAAAIVSWKGVVVSLVESLRWPVAAVAIAVVFRHPLAALIDAVTHAATH